MKVAFYKPYHSGVGKAHDVYHDVSDVAVRAGGALVSFTHQPKSPALPREWIICNLPFKIIYEANDDPQTAVQYFL